MNRYLAYIKEVLFLLGENSRKLPLLVLLFLAASILDLVGIGLIAPYVALLVNPEAFVQSEVYPFFVSMGLSPQPESLLLSLSIGLVLIFAIKFVSAIFINWIIIRFCFQQSVHLRAQLMKIYQHLPYVEYLQRNSSEYIHNITTLVPQFSLSILQSFLRLVSEGIVSLVIIALLAWYNALALGILVGLLVVIMFAYDLFFRRRIAEYGRLANDSSIRMLQGINEGIDGLKEIRVLGKESYFHNIVVEGASVYSDVSKKSTIISTAPRYFLEFILVAFIVLLVIGTLLLGQNIQDLMPTLSIFGVAAMRLMPSANQMLNGVSQIRFGRHAVSRLFSDMQFQKRLIDAELHAPSVRDYDTFQDMILKDVYFSYPKTKQHALNGISLDIHANDSIGLIGSSGSGKTTLVDMLLGLLEPKSGEILFNGRPLNSCLDNLRSQVAYLPQEVFLIDDTLRKNVALGIEDSEIDNKKINRALKQARLSELVNIMPQGVDTMLGERGARLSGGQRQRIALARAFYHGRSILVMDESTSALDSETESEIIKEIKQLKGHITIIVIAHRLATVEHCDRIYRLEMGEIVAED
jgi:ABC-type multidrug transport system fused ATPase/permease subunit